MRDRLLIDHLKEFHSKANTNNFNVLDFVSAFGNPLEALAYSYLFWPDFVEFEGMIFHQGSIEDDEDRSRIRAARSEFSSRKEVEQSFNQFVIPDSFFASKISTTTDDEDLFLAERIAEMWRARLAQLFPNKNCVVEVQLPPETEEGPTIVVYQA
jgi:hypothetical protein